MNLATNSSGALSFLGKKRSNRPKTSFRSRPGYHSRTHTATHCHTAGAPRRPSAPLSRSHDGSKILPLVPIPSQFAQGEPSSSRNRLQM
ncbi:RING finger and transmembrane domain-containing protein 1 [Anopheles sinensis]|uniref:RING finger and transmembrane domain-containing protein 1 n=1 Tax=Anopheles sinensis TaxID=74873 RepID=A0A084W537_ANOSI|nr:RING finger and transmembrane domain-containing protein 1 [Anopheles sinensis]